MTFKLQHPGDLISRLFILEYMREIGAKALYEKANSEQKKQLFYKFIDEDYAVLKNKYNLENDNDIATKAIRLCLERVRKQTGKSVKHWFITELGHEKTERLHLHVLVS